MATGKQWLAGCGIGCLALIIIAVGLGAGSFFFLKDKVEDIEAWQERNEELLAELGAPGDYTPAVDGAVGTDRLDLFLDIRETMGPAREEFVEVAALIPSDEDDVSFVEGLRIAWNMRRILPAFGAYHEARNVALVDAGMSLGEYFYIHTMAYHWWLGHSPADGPDIEHESRGGGVYINVSNDEDDTMSVESAWRRYNDVVRDQLHNQLSQIDPETRDPDLQQLKKALQHELETLRYDEEYIPWSDGLPAGMADRLEPRRDRFEDSYEKITNVFDLMTEFD